jgi:hypothetical protein
MKKINRKAKRFLLSVKILYLLNKQKKTVTKKCCRYMKKSKNQYRFINSAMILWQRIKQVQC